MPTCTTATWWSSVADNLWGQEVSGGAAWRPLRIDSEDEVAEYDALHDGVPSWMAAGFWA